MPSSCSVAGCFVRKRRGGSESLHRIPRCPPERRFKWIEALKRSKPSDSWEPGKGACVCNRHFVSGAPSNDPQSVDWVPTLLLTITAPLEKQRRKYLPADDSLNILNVRPYTCTFCGKFFAQNDSLKRHHQLCVNARTWHLIATEGCFNISPMSNKCGMSQPQPLKEKESHLIEKKDAVVSTKKINETFSIFLLNSQQHLNAINDIDSNHEDSTTFGQALSMKETKKLKNVEVSSAKTNSIDAICADLAKLHDQQSGQDKMLSESFVHDINNKPVSQTSLTSLLDYLIVKGQLYRCEHCQIFFLDSAMHHLHQSQHATNSSSENPYVCSVCGYAAEEKYAFQTHFIEHHKKYRHE